MEVTGDLRLIAAVSVDTGTETDGEKEGFAAGAVRAYRKWGHACGITKKGQESLVKGYGCGLLLLIFPNLGHLERYTPEMASVFGIFSGE